MPSVCPQQAALKIAEGLSAQKQAASRAMFSPRLRQHRYSIMAARMSKRIGKNFIASISNIS